jgi:hypothetical protein
MKDFSGLFAALRAILQPYAAQLDCIVDGDGEFSLNTRHLLENKRPLWFGGVQVKKNYVSYHLMPVYLNSDLLGSLSPELRKRMQGKSCFNFTAVDETLLAELAELTPVAFQDYQRQGYV